MQIATDGLKASVRAMDDGFGGEVDHATLVKVYGDATRDEARYSPPKCVVCLKTVGNGNPDLAGVSTSYIERQNLTIRMRNRRFTGLTNAFRKKLANLEHSVVPHFFAYNFITRHGSLRMPPARKAKVTKHWWAYEERVELIGRPQTT